MDATVASRRTQPVEPSLCVAVPAFNRQQELGRALDSLLAQTDQRFEVIVCDDGSTEDLGAVVERYVGRLAISLIRIPNSGGPARPRNTVMRATCATWLAFLDSDDWWFPNKISRIRTELSDAVDVVFHPLQVQAAGSAAQPPGGSTRLVGFRPRRQDMLQHMIRFGNPLATSGTVVRRQSLMDVGGFCEAPEIASVEDFDAWMQLACRGAKFRFVSEVLGAYWVGTDNISAFNARQYARQEAFFTRQLSSLSGAPLRVAQANFSYLLGSYGLQLGRADALTQLRRVRAVDDWRIWLKARTKLLWALVT